MVKTIMSLYVFCLFFGCLVGCESGGDDSECDNDSRKCSATGDVMICTEGTWHYLSRCPTETVCVGGECVKCQPQCTGRVCGDDGCGGSCGDCTGEETCNQVTGQCQSGCTPDCSGRECGPDPECGTSCGTCDGGKTCNQVTGQCQSGCTPDCSGRECGPDPECGTSCGTCDGGKTCNADGRCTGGDPCAGVDCGRYGSCNASGGVPHCVCDQGYHDENLKCVPDDPNDPCFGIDCSSHGSCVVDGFLPIPHCVCDEGYHEYGLACVLERRLGCRRDSDDHFVRRGTTRCDATDSYLEVCFDEDGDGLMEWIYGADCKEKPCSDGCLRAGCRDGQQCPVGTSCIETAHGQYIWACIAVCDCSNCGNCDASDDWSGMQNYCGNTDGNPAMLSCNLPCPTPGEGCIPFNPPICWGMEGCFSAPPDGP